jgi:hypothetical protein
MLPRSVTLAGVLVALPAMMAPLEAKAGGHCREIECYEKVRTGPVYGTVATPVVIAPARTEYVRTPAIIGSRPEQVVVRPGWISTHQTPAVYATIPRTVEVAPARAYYTHSAPVYDTRRREVVVKAGGWRWERKVDAHGRVTMCKVATPAVTRVVTERVLVHPGHRQLHITPALTREVHRTVIVREAATHKVYHPGVYAWVNRPVVVVPPTVHAVTRPPVVRYEHRKVLVHSGRDVWRPVRRHSW